MTEDVFQEVVVPLLGMNNVAVLGISTPAFVLTHITQTKNSVDLLIHSLI